MLKSYMARIDPKVHNICPDCNSPGHTTKHLFECSAKPTNLTPKDLWLQPIETATFLGLPGIED
jgi:hypothetical protein